MPNGARDCGTNRRLGQVSTDSGRAVVIFQTLTPESRRPEWQKRQRASVLRTPSLCDSAVNPYRRLGARGAKPLVDAGSFQKAHQTVAHFLPKSACAAGGQPVRQMGLGVFLPRPRRPGAEYNGKWTVDSGQWAISGVAVVTTPRLENPPCRVTHLNRPDLDARRSLSTVHCPLSIVNYPLTRSAA